MDPNIPPTFRSDFWAIDFNWQLDFIWEDVEKEEPLRIAGASKMAHATCGAYL